jgi:hypothetical protein
MMHDVLRRRYDTSDFSEAQTRVVATSEMSSGKETRRFPALW